VNLILVLSQRQDNDLTINRNSIIKGPDDHKIYDYRKGTTNFKIIISDHYLRFKKLRCDYSQITRNKDIYENGK
jgi:hypothetical protein